MYARMHVSIIQLLHEFSLNAYTTTHIRISLCILQRIYEFSDTGKRRCSRRWWILRIHIYEVLCMHVETYVYYNSYANFTHTCIYYNSYTNTQASAAAVGGGGGAARLVPHGQDRRDVYYNSCTNTYTTTHIRISQLVYEFPYVYKNSYTNVQTRRCSRRWRRSSPPRS